ncbi:alpha/beta hydrolase [Taklimakanibacter deserti]|uniref:alpha/beta hydrolase n=1 Tax=Taklimakanibacter deserti TaxID=2267839 RepID=UPI000E6578F0
MDNNRLAALVLILTAFLGCAGLAEARDSSLCAQKDPTGLAAGAKPEPCPEAKGEPATASAAQPVLRHDAAATTPVIAGPITHARHFVYRLLRPEAPSTETIVLLHGSGGDEASLFKLALRVAPDATLLGVRGRIVQKGIKRWYARITPTEFDQADIRKEAKAFVDFLKSRMAAEKLDLEHTVFIGYSNGANLIAAVSLLYPGLIERAVLLRAMPVLTKAPETDLRRVRFLTVSGEKDRIYAPFAPVLEALLRNRGATVDARQVAAGHLLGDEDVKVVSDWLSAADMMAGDTKQ